MEDTAANHDVPLGAIPRRMRKEKSRWSTEEYPSDHLRGPSVDTLLAASDRSSDSIEANSSDEPRVQEPYEVALKVRVDLFSMILLLTVLSCRSSRQPMTRSCLPLHFAPSSWVLVSQLSERTYLSSDFPLHCSLCYPTTVCWHKFIISSPRISLFRRYCYSSFHLPLATQCTLYCHPKVFSDGSTQVPSTVSCSLSVLASRRNYNRVPVKEHAAVVIMASTASTSATAIQVIAVQERESRRLALHQNESLTTSIHRAVFYDHTMVRIAVRVFEAY